MTPDEFAAECRAIVANERGHTAHASLDRITTELLCSLGYSEGMAIFSRAVQDWHHPQLRYPMRHRPRWLCRTGWHRWRVDSEAVWSFTGAEICIECGKRRSFNPCP